MKPILCHCPDCRRHRITRRAIVQSRHKRWRSTTRWLLRAGRYDKVPVTFYVGYTDWPLRAGVIGGLILKPSAGVATVPPEWVVANGTNFLKLPADYTKRHQQHAHWKQQAAT